jgi:hypothetical protein
MWVAVGHRVAVAGWQWDGCVERVIAVILIGGKLTICGSGSGDSRWQSVAVDGCVAVAIHNHDVGGSGLTGGSGWVAVG